MYNALNREDYIKPMIKFFKANENKKLVVKQKCIKKNLIKKYL